MTETKAPIPAVTDPHGLLASGEPVATLAELAQTFGLSMKALRLLVHDRAEDATRYVRRFPSRESLYAVADVKRAVDKNRTWLDERRRAASELEATQRAAKAAKNAASEAKSNARRDRGPPSSRKVPRVRTQSTPSGRAPSVPEVFVRKAR